MKIKLTLILCLTVMVGCTSTIQKVNLAQDSIDTYENMAKTQRDLQIDAHASHDYAESLLHEVKADYYNRKARSFKDTLFNLEYIKK